jgi:hypothetical protein
VPIRLRLALFCALSTAALIAIGGYLFLQVFSSDLIRSVDAGLSARATTFAETVAGGEAFAFPDQRIEGLAPSEDSLAQLIAPTGEVVESSPGMSDNSLLSPAELKRARHDQVWLTGSAGSVRWARLLALPAHRGPAIWW